MSAVGLSDLYRYGARFVGYGLVVTAAGGAFVAGGYVLGASDISTQAASNEALLGIAAGAIGVLLVLSGLVGLVYKLIADAVMAGTAAALRTRAADAEAAAAATDGSATEEAQTEETETDDTAKPVPAGAPAADEPDAPAEEPSATAETEPTTEPAEPTVENPQPTAESEHVAEESQPTADAEASMSDDDGAEPAEPAAEEPPQAAPAADDGADEPAAGDGADESTDDQPESATAESVDLFEDAEGSEPTEAAERDAEAPPQEWSPPDPSEFERSESVEPSTDDAAETDGDQDDEFDGWDTAGTEETESDADAPRTAADLFGDPEGGTSPGDQSAEGGDEQSDKRLIDDGDVEEPADEETTLADEGVEGFDVDSDSDPLSDALDDE